MKTSRYTEAQILAILRQAEGGVPVAELCREMAETAMARRGASIALACWAFGVSENWYRYSPKLRAENEEIADLLLGLTDARKT